MSRCNIDINWNNPEPNHLKRLTKEFLGAEKTADKLTEEDKKTLVTGLKSKLAPLNKDLCDLDLNNDSELTINEMMGIFEIAPERKASDSFESFSLSDTARLQRYLDRKGYETGSIKTNKDGVKIPDCFFGEGTANAALQLLEDRGIKLEDVSGRDKKIDPKELDAALEDLDLKEYDYKSFGSVNFEDPTVERKTINSLKEYLLKNASIAIIEQIESSPEGFIFTTVSDHIQEIGAFDVLEKYELPQHERQKDKGLIDWGKITDKGLLDQFLADLTKAASK